MDTPADSRQAQRMPSVKRKCKAERPKKDAIDKLVAQGEVSEERAELIVAVLNLRAKSISQRRIASVLGIHESSVSRIVQRYGVNTTSQARAILESQAASMALNIARTGRAADHIQALKSLPQADSSGRQLGQSVLTPDHRDASHGLTININGFALVGLGIRGESEQKGQQIPSVSDNTRYVNEANSLIDGELVDAERKPGEGKLLKD